MIALTVSPDRLRLLEGSTPFRWRGTLTRTLFGLWMHDPIAARAVVRDRKACGANTVCFDSQLNWSHFHRPYGIFGPTVTPNYHQQIRPFAAMLTEEDMRACMVVLCDTATLMPDLQAMRNHWQWCYTAVGDQPHWTLVLANQIFHSTQAEALKDHYLEFEQPPSIAGFPPLLAARDNPNEDAHPTLPPWDFSCFCSKRNEPFWWMEGSGLSMATIVHDVTHAATVLFEPPPCGRPDHPEWADAGKWRQFARALCFEGTIGGNFYSDEDARSDLYLPGVVRNSAVEMLGNIPAA